MVTLSKYLQETGDRLGIPALAITRGVYSAAIVGYFIRVAYPRWKNKSKPKPKPKTETEDSDDEEAMRAKAMALAVKKPHGPGVNREFFRRLRLLFKIMFPKLWSKETGILCMNFHIQSKF